MALLSEHVQQDLEPLVAVRGPPGIALQLGFPLPRLAVLLREEVVVGPVHHLCFVRSSHDHASQRTSLRSFTVIA
jgi:hypothetical protein